MDLGRRIGDHLVSSYRRQFQKEEEERDERLKTFDISDRDLAVCSTAAGSEESKTHTPTVPPETHQMPQDNIDEEFRRETSVGSGVGSTIAPLTEVTRIKIPDNFRDLQNSFGSQGSTSVGEATHILSTDRRSSSSSDTAGRLGELDLAGEFSRLNLSRPSTPPLLDENQSSVRLVGEELDGGSRSRAQPSGKSLPPHESNVVSKWRSDLEKDVLASLPLEVALPQPGQGLISSYSPNPSRYATPPPGALLQSPSFPEARVHIRRVSPVLLVRTPVTAIRGGVKGRISRNPLSSQRGYLTTRSSASSSVPPALRKPTVSTQLHHKFPPSMPTHRGSAGSAGGWKVGGTVGSAQPEVETISRRGVVLQLAGEMPGELPEPKPIISTQNEEQIRAEEGTIMN